MLKYAALIAGLASALVASRSPAGAAAIRPAFDIPSLTEHVAGGCGPGRWRGPYGGCRSTPFYGVLPNGYYQPPPHEFSVARPGTGAVRGVTVATRRIMAGCRAVAGSCNYAAVVANPRHCERTKQSPSDNNKEIASRYALAMTHEGDDYAAFARSAISTNLVRISAPPLSRASGSSQSSKNTTFMSGRTCAARPASG